MARVGIDEDQREVLSLGNVLNFDSLARLPADERDTVLRQFGELISVSRECVMGRISSYVHSAIGQKRDAATRLWLECLQQAYQLAPSLTATGIIKDIEKLFRSDVMKLYWTLPRRTFLPEYQRRQPIFLETKKYIIDVVMQKFQPNPSPDNKELFRWFAAVCGCTTDFFIPYNEAYDWFPIMHPAVERTEFSQGEEDYILMHLDRKFKRWLRPFDIKGWLDEPVVEYGHPIGEMIAHAWVSTFHAKELRHCIKRSNAFQGITPD